MNRLVRTIAAPVLAAAVTLSAGLVAATPASAMNCLTCDPGTGGGGSTGGTPSTPIPSSGVGGAGNSFGWGPNSSTNFLSVHVHTNPIDGHSAWWMDDTATLNRQTGQVQLSGTIEDDQLFVGYTGGVHVIGMDNYGNVLAQTSINAAGVADDPAWGVCGKWEFCNYSRPLGAVLQMTGDYQDVTHLEIVNWHDQKNRLGDDLVALANLLGQVKNGIAAGQSIAGLFS